MKTSKQNIVVRQTILAIAVLAAIGQARAQVTDEVKQLTNPESSVSVGAAGVSGDSKDRAQFGIFNGMREHKRLPAARSGLHHSRQCHRNLDDCVRTQPRSRQPGIPCRHAKTGDWKVFGEYNEITRHSPFTVNTAMVNAGTTTPTVVALTTPGTGTDLDFKTERKAASAGVEKWIFPSLKFEATFKNETKEGHPVVGARL